MSFYETVGCIPITLSLLSLHLPGVSMKKLFFQFTPPHNNGFSAEVYLGIAHDCQSRRCTDKTAKPWVLFVWEARTVRTMRWNNNSNVTKSFEKRYHPLRWGNCTKELRNISRLKGFRFWETAKTVFFVEKKTTNWTSVQKLYSKKLRRSFKKMYSREIFLSEHLSIVRKIKLKFSSLKKTWNSLKWN